MNSRSPVGSSDEARRVERQVAERLAAAGIPTPEVDARWLVDHALEVTGEVTGGATGDATGGGGALLDGLVARRVAREPLQLVVGRTWFRTLELRCAPGVFIPRPETEIVAGLAIDAARAAVARSADGRAKLVEPCTGTGAIALSVAVEVAGVQVVAGDSNAAAVALASDNLGRVLDGSAGPAMAERSSVAVVASDLLDGVEVSWRGHLDVLVANPPYLPASDRATWAPEVAEHDPDHALVGGPDGHEVVDALLELASDWLAPGGVVVLEIDERRGDEAITAATRAGLVAARVERDLTGAPRAIVAERPVGSR